MKIGICDDNKIYLGYLKHTVDSLVTERWDVTIEVIKPEDMSDQINQGTCPYDILITDIDMGSFNGIEFAKKINELNPACIIIFISSYLNFATDVYEVKHIYFVLKSEAEVKLPKALEKAFCVLYERTKNHLTFHYQNCEYRMFYTDITYMEALGRYLYIHDRTQSYKCINSLKAIANELSASFIRCHNSFIVNAEYIRSVSRTGCILTTGDTIPISQTYAKSFQAAYVAYVSEKLK